MKTWILICLIHVGLSAQAPRVHVRSYEGESLLLEARGLRIDQKYFEAVERYRRYLADHPEGPRAYEARFWMAKCLFRDQRWDEAAEAFTLFLARHPEHRRYGIEARKDRIACWELRQGQNPKATPGLQEALRDPEPVVRVLAALALARTGETSGRSALEEGLGLDETRERCAQALARLGLPAKPGNSGPRFLVVRYKSSEPGRGFVTRVALSSLRQLELTVGPEAWGRISRHGMPRIADLAAKASRGDVLFQVSVDGGKSEVTVTVE